MKMKIVDLDGFGVNPGDLSWEAISKLGDWTFLGQSLPVWSLVYFSFILLICLWQLFRKYDSTKA